MRNIAKIQCVAGLYRIRILPAGVRYPLTVTAQPSYKLAVRHIKTRFPGFQIVDAKTFDAEEDRRFEAAQQERKPLAQEGLNG